MTLLSLPERPKAETLSVEDILSEASAGRLRVPHFQSGLRWRGEHVVELFDSIMRGFPVGSLLLWEHKAEAERLTFGSVQIEAPPTGAAWYIVDGQQRITALVGALLHPEERPLRDTHAVWVDLERAEFFIPKGVTEVQRGHIPLRLLGDRHRLLRWSRGIDDARLIDRAFEIASVLLKYTIPIYLVRGTEQETLQQIFKRTNSAGVPLKEAEVFQALFGDEARR